MTAHNKYTLSRPHNAALLLVVFIALVAGWLSFTFLLAKVASHDLSKMIGELSFEFCKTIFVAVVVTLVLDLYLKRFLGEGKEARLANAGIQDIYPTRSDVTADLLHSVEEAATIDMMGISLQDFLRGGKWQAVWEAVAERLLREHEQNVPKERRLHVRLLMIDPHSSEGRFRSSVEKPTSLTYDVPRGLQEVIRVKDSIATKEAENVLQVHLYQHCPFFLLFLTDKDAYVEQYCYKENPTHVGLPLIRYSKRDRQRDLHKCYDVVWRAAGPGVLPESYVGTAYAIEEAAIKNIYRRRERAACGQRQAEALQGLRKDQIARIMTVSGKYYVSNALLRHEMREAFKRGAKIRFLLLNPVSCQAILRAIADTSEPNDIGAQLAAWNWAQHRGTRLYTEIHQTIRELSAQADTASPPDIRLHYSSVACSLLLTPEQSFVEQYIYGRSVTYRTDRPLGGEYPIIEFGQREATKAESGGTEEQQMLAETYEVVWKYFSINLKRYFAEVDEEKEFGKSLEDLKRWFVLSSEAKPDTHT